MKSLDSIWKYFSFSKKNSRIFEHDLAAIFMGSYILVKSLKNAFESEHSYNILYAVYIIYSYIQLYIIYSILFIIWPKSPIWLFFGKFDPSLTSDDFVWPDLKHMYIWYIRLTGPIWPLLDRFDQSFTSDDPNWPWKIWNLNFWVNSLSKHMYIDICILNTFRLIRPIRP